MPRFPTWDDMAMSDGTVGVAAPWTIKSVPTKTRFTVIEVALKEGVKARALH